MRSMVTLQNENILPDDNLLIAISMENTTEQGSKSQTGENLEALTTLLKSKGCQRNVTFVIADSLQRFNDSKKDVSADEKLALEGATDEGMRFRMENVKAFEGFKVIHWKKFIEERKDNFNKMKAIIENELIKKESSPLYKAMKRTTFETKIIKDFFSKKPINKIDAQHLIENSFALLTEEYAAILASPEFKFLIYPKLTPGMAYVLNLDNFQEAHKPVPRPSYNGYDVKKPSQAVITGTKYSFFEEYKPSKPLLPAFQMVINNVVFLMNSSEYSEESKIGFYKQLLNQLMVVNHPRGFAKDIQIVSNSLSPKAHSIDDSMKSTSKSTSPRAY